MGWSDRIEGIIEGLSFIPMEREGERSYSGHYASPP